MLTERPPPNKSIIATILTSRIMTSLEEMSAVEVFFYLLNCSDYDRDLLLDPKEHHYNRMMNSIVRFCEAEPPVGDADYDFIRSWLPNDPRTTTRGAMRVLNHRIAQLARSKAPEQLQDTSATTKAFRFYRWITQGRNDADRSSFERGNSLTPASREEREAAAALPVQTPESCAKCKVTFLNPYSNEIASCTRCAILDGERKISCVSYCSSECKRKHKNNHKKNCRIRRGVIYAAHLLQKLMYVLEANGTRVQYRDVAVQDGVTSLEVVWNEEVAFRGLPAVWPLHRQQTSDEVETETAYDGAVMYASQREVLCRGRELLELLIRPYCKDIKIFSVSAKNAVQPVSASVSRIARHKAGYNMLDEHCILRLELRSGEEMVLDVTGLQFGWKEPIAPWSTWCEKRALSIGVAEMLSSTIETHSHGSWALAADHCALAQKQEEVREDMAIELGSILKSDISGLQECLGLPVQEYEVWEERIFSDAAERCQAVVDKLLADGKARVYYEVVDEKWQFALTKSQQECQALRSEVVGCWFNEKALEEIDYDGAKLAVYWKQRCSHHHNQEAFCGLEMHMGYTLENMHAFIKRCASGLDRMPRQYLKL